MICNNCSAELAEGALFCHKCGNKVIEPTPSTDKADADSLVVPTQIESVTVAESTNNNVSELPQKGIRKVINKLKKTSKKKLIILICCSVLIIGTVILIVCLNLGSSSSSYSSSYGSSYSTEDYLESLVTSALYNELSQRFSYTDAFNLGATRYSIGSVTESDTQWIIRGTFSLYNYYGEITSYYNETFTVKIDKSTYRTTCNISI